MMTRGAKRKLQEEEEESQTEPKYRNGVKVESDPEISAQFTKIDDLTESKELKENEKMCISFSNFPYQSSMDEFRGKYVAFFESKGVQISTEKLFDPETTHLVARKMWRSEKMLGSIASGKWILHPSYIEACFAAKEILLNFTDFEWGNPENGFLPEVTAYEPYQLELAQAAFSSRQFINKNPSNGIFTGIRAIVHTNEDRKVAFARLILAGKGVVIENAKPPYMDAKEATHCLAEPKKLPNKHLNFEALAKQQVAVIGSNFLSEFLTTGSPPNIEEFLVDGYKSIYKKHFITGPPFLPIDKICQRYPHVGEIIFNYLDDQSLQQSREVCKTWSTFLNLKPFYWTRMMKNYIRGQEEFSVDWNRFFKHIPVAIAKEFALYIAYCRLKNSSEFFKVARSPLHIAAMNGNLTIFEYIHEKVTEKNPRDYRGRVPLHIAASNNNFRICEFIHKKGNPLDQRSPNGSTPLHAAASHGRFDSFEYLFKMVEEKNPCDHNGSMPIHQAAKKGHFLLFKYIYEKTAEKNLQDNIGWMPIHYAANNGQLEICKYIHEKGDNLNPQANDGRTPLLISARKGHFEVCRFLFGVVGQTMNEAQKAEVVTLLKAKMNDTILSKLIMSFLE